MWSSNGFYSTDESSTLGANTHDSQLGHWLGGTLHLLSVQKELGDELSLSHTLDSLTAIPLGGAGMGDSFRGEKEEDRGRHPCSMNLKAEIDFS